MITAFRFTFRPVEITQRELVHSWLHTPHVAKWFYGQGLENTIKHLDEFFQNTSSSHYWLAYDKQHPFAFFITSSVDKPTDELSKWCQEEGDTITLDMLIGDTNYLGKGLSPILIKEFLLSQFPKVSEVLIDPEATNTHAIHIYQKVGFKILGEFIPSHSPYPHYMMRLSTKELQRESYYLEHYDMIPSDYENILFKGISDHAFQKKQLPPIKTFSIFIKDQNQNIWGGISGASFYESLYIDSLWIEETIRHQSWGTQLMYEAEKFAKKKGARFITLNTMDWEGLLFYQKLGYAIEFVREGYAKNSKMYLLRKDL